MTRSCSAHAQVPALRVSLTRGVDWVAVAAWQRKQIFAPHALRPSAARLERLIAAADEPETSRDPILQVAHKPSIHPPINSGCDADCSDPC